MDMDNFAPAAADPLMDRLADQYAGLRARTAELVTALDRVPATIDETTIDRAAGFVKQVKLCAKEAEDKRKSEKDDFLRAGRTVDSFFRAIIDQLAATATEVERRMQLFLKRKADEERRCREEEARRVREEAERAAAEARRVREEAERKEREARENAERIAREAREAEAARLAALTPADDPAETLAAQRCAEEEQQRRARQEQERQERERAEAEQREREAQEEARRLEEEAREAERRASAKTADMARTRGALGGTATLATTLDFEVTDRLAAVRELASFFDDAAIDKAARAYMRADRDGIRRQIANDQQPVQGVRFFESHKARVA